MENEKMQTVMQQVNDLELKFRDKQETFWKHMFMCCTGFVAVITPMSLQIDMPTGARICLAIAVASIALCTLCIVPLLYSSVRCYKVLVEHGQKVARGESVDYDFSPVNSTGLERWCMKFSVLLILIALVCLTGACMFV